MLKKDSLEPAGSVLLVEDSDDVREFIVEILTGDGFAVSTARDGNAALNLINSRRFDLVICDIGLPDTDGEKLLKNMRTNSIDTPVLLISGIRMIEKKNADDHRDYNFIYKPFEINEIKEAISGLLNRK